MAMQTSAELRWGFTTGACAAAAAKAAAHLLAGEEPAAEVSILLPDGESVALPVERAGLVPGGAEAVIRKDAGDDPDVTDGALVVVRIEPLEASAGEDIVFRAGEGVGTVTKPGLSVPVGEPGINPGPRAMIRQAVRDVLDKPVAVTVSIPGGQALAEKTFNPRLGVMGGLSILGTTGRVRPFSHEALRDAIRCGVDVAAAGGITSLVLVPGNIGAKAARHHFSVPEESVLEVANAWDAALDRIADHAFRALLAVGHPGKLAKLAMGHWDTHSRASPPAAPWVREFLQTTLGRAMDDASTVQGLFDMLDPMETRRAGDALAAKIHRALERRSALPCAVCLIDMTGDVLGQAGDFEPWRTN